MLFCGKKLTEQNSVKQQISARSKLGKRWNLETNKNNINNSNNNKQEMQKRRRPESTGYSQDLQAFVCVTEQYTIFRP